MPSLESAVTPLTPLCVDMDGSLVKCDTLHDLILLFLKQQPKKALKMVRWLLGGKANLKKNLAHAITLDVQTLPYNRSVIEYLKASRKQGRELYLVTGADTAVAESVADYLGLFDGVIASDGKTNRVSDKKLLAMHERFGERGFDYIGNSMADLQLLECAGQAMVANPHRMLSAVLRRKRIAIASQFVDRPGYLRSVIKAIRLHQWAKNAIIFLPVLLSHEITVVKMLQATIAFFVFSLCASATYIVNDLLDISTDRLHPRKSRRPFAAADLSVPAGILLIVLLGLISVAGSAILPVGFCLILAGYVLATLSYSFFFKRIVLVDAFILSGLYTSRLLAGAASTHTQISAWLSAFSIFFFLSLALVKRFSELKAISRQGLPASNGRGYVIGDLEQLRSTGTSSAFAAAVVFAMYIGNSNVTELYPHPFRMWLIVPVLLFWITRVWLLASRGELDEDPVLFAIQDRVSLVLGLVVIAVGVLASIR